MSTPIEFDWVEEFDSALHAEIMDRELESGIPAEKWTAAGRATKANPNGEDYDWWLKNGPDIAKAWADWRVANEDTYDLWYTPDGVPGIELPMFVKFGGTTVKAFIDRVYRRKADGKLVVIDLKSGAKPQEDALQINIYRACLELQYPGVRTAMGFFFNNRKGELQPAHGPTQYDLPTLVALVNEFARSLRAGVFLPNPGWHCKNCEVKRFCALTGGAESADHDPLHPAYVEAA